MNVVVSHVDDSTRVRLCTVFEFLSDECRQANIWPPDRVTLSREALRT